MKGKPRSPVEFEQLPRNERRHRMKLAMKAKGEVDDYRSAVDASGAGYPIDQELREHLRGFNIRVDEDPRNPVLPGLYGVLQGFTEEKHVIPNVLWSFILAPERDHAYLADDLLEFVRGGECPDRGISRLRSIPENVIHNFTALGDILDLQFSTEDGQPYVVSGISLIRRSNRLHWLMLGGIVCDLANQSENIRDKHRNGTVTKRFTENTFDPDKLEAAPLLGQDGVWKTIACGIFDLDKAVHQIRSFSHDQGVAYATITDDPGNFPVGVGADETCDMRGQLDEHKVIFDLAETLFMLPAYFSYRINLVRDVEKKTRASLNAKAVDAARIMRAPSGAKTFIRKVQTLEVINLAAEVSTRSYTPPRFQVGVEGFWRTLRPGSMGRDAEGQPVRGMTWVAGHVRWRDRPAQTGVVLVKRSHAAARALAEKLIAAGGVVSVTAGA